VPQQAPGLTAAQDAKDRIQHQPQVMLARAPAAGGGGQERRQGRLRRIAQVSVVASSCHALQMGTARFSRHPLESGRPA